MTDLTHIDAEGHARMVDVAGREVTTRTATARGRVTTGATALIRSGGVPKGDVLAVARIAGIMATKRTPDLIPLCHPIAVHGVDVEVAPPEQPIYGSIINILGGLTQGGQFDVVVLDRGARDGLVPGDVLRIDQKGRIVRDRVPLDQGVAPEIRTGWGGIPQAFDDAATLHDLRPAATDAERFRELRTEIIQPGQPIKLPDEEAGLLMVFRTDERISVALIMESTRPINVGDRVRNP